MSNKSPPTKPPETSLKRKKQLERIKKKILSGQYLVSANEIAKAMVSR